jgi:hypothetical protein
MGLRAAFLGAASLLISASADPGAVQARTFAGYPCEGDCSDLAAGYRWAEERDIDDAKACAPGLSDAFYKGCLAYIADPDRGADVDDQGGRIEVASHTR